MPTNKSLKTAEQIELQNYKRTNILISFIRISFLKYVCYWYALRYKQMREDKAEQYTHKKKQVSH